LPPEDLEQQKYWIDYFDRMDVKVYWGKANNFMAELRDRWSEFTK
jgi:hypothetical protein